MTTTTEETTNRLPDRAEIVIEYCNKVEFTHGHKVVETAAAEYSTMLQSAIQMEASALTPRHIRQVHMHVFDADDGHERSHIRTGLFPCSHRR